MGNQNEWTEVGVEFQEEFSKKHTSATSLQVVKTAPAATERYVIDTLWATGTAKGTLEIFDSDNNAIDGYFFAFTADSGFIIEGKHLKQIPLGKGFKYSTTGGGTHSVVFKFHKRNE